MDTKNWKIEDGGETLECNIGLHQYQTVLDWSLLKIPYTSADNQQIMDSWQCIDAHQFFDDVMGIYSPEILED